MPALGARPLLAFTFLAAVCACSQGAPDSSVEVMVDPDQLPAFAKVNTVEFIGISDIHPLSAFRDVAAHYEDQTFQDNEWASEISGRAKDAAQQAGYFTAEVTPSFKVARNSAGPADVSVTLSIEKGDLYRLKEIVVTGAKEFPAGRIRELFLLYPGEIFDTALIRHGLEKMREVYGERGYLNFTPVPETKLYPDKKIRLTIDIDEGKQFRIGEIRVFGTSQNVAREIIRTFPRRGSLYNSADIEAAFNEIRPKIPVELRLESPELIDIRKHEAEGVVDLTLHLEQPN